MVDLWDPTRFAPSQAQVFGVVVPPSTTLRGRLSLQTLRSSTPSRPPVTTTIFRTPGFRPYGLQDCRFPLSSEGRVPFLSGCTERRQRQERPGGRIAYHDGCDSHPEGAHLVSLGVRSQVTGDLCGVSMWVFITKWSRDPGGVDQLKCGV